MKRKALAVSPAALFALSGASEAFGNASPPTNAGNGAGQSGQCTGPASERPAVCPGTWRYEAVFCQSCPA